MGKVMTNCSDRGTEVTDLAIVLIPYFTTDHTNTRTVDIIIPKEH